MKKLLLCMTIATAVTISCKKTKDDNSVAPPSENVVLNKTCDTSVVVDKSKIINYDAWKIEGANETLICNPDTEGNDIYIDLSKMPFDNTNNTKKAQWLKTNGDYVNHDLSRTYIRKSHIIDKSLYSITIKSNIVTKRISEIQNTGGMNPTTFGTDSYKQYLEITTDTTDINNTKMTFNYKNNFGVYANKTYYSIPLLRSVIYGFDYNNDEIEFAIAQIKEISSGNKNDRLVMKIKGTDLYFDITRWPAKK